MIAQAANRTFDPRIFDFSVSGPSLRGHIAGEHLKPLVLATVGVPQDDIDFAKHLGYELSWVVARIREKLSRDDAAIQDEIFQDGAVRVLTVAEYRQRLLDTLNYIEAK